MASRGLVVGARATSYLTVDSLRPSSGPTRHLLPADVELAAPGRAQSFSVESQAHDRPWRVDVTGTAVGGGRPDQAGPGTVQPVVQLPPVVAAEHRAAVAALRESYAALPAGAPVRLAKRTSNLFRFRDPLPSRTAGRSGGPAATPGLDVSAFSRVLHVDPKARTAVVGGMTTYEDLADATLPHGLMPLVVPQLKTITLGGAVTGLGIESTSPEACMDAVGQLAAEASLDGHRADFVDGTAFGPGEIYLTVGAYSDVAPWVSDYTGQRIYYQSVRGPREDFLTIRDYLWRWDADWFWCSRPFGVQHPAIRRAWPRRYRRSDVYRSLVTFDRRYRLWETLNARRGRPPREAVIQDVEIPLERAAAFARFFAGEVGMSPVWLCPLRLRGDQSWPLYPLQAGEVYVNFGFWGTVPLPPGCSDGHYNRRVETEVAALGGLKSLYSTSFYSPEQFWEHYNGPAYAALKREYDGAGRLAGLYEKCVRGQ